jgi:hypothetical protein
MLNLVSPLLFSFIVLCYLLVAFITNPKNGSLSFYLLGFYLQSFQEKVFSPGSFSVSTFVGSCNLIFY